MRSEVSCSSPALIWEFAQLFEKDIPGWLEAGAGGFSHWRTPAITLKSDEDGQITWWLL